MNVHSSYYTSVKYPPHLLFPAIFSDCKIKGHNALGKICIVYCWLEKLQSGCRLHFFSVVCSPSSKAAIFLMASQKNSNRLFFYGILFFIIILYFLCLFFIPGYFNCRLQSIKWSCNLFDKLSENLGQDLFLILTSARAMKAGQR